MVPITAEPPQSESYYKEDPHAKWADTEHQMFFTHPSIKEFCFHKLSGLSILIPGWDSVEAPAISQNAIKYARQFVADLPEYIAPLPMVVPMTSGHVQLEWHEGRKVLELEFDSSGSVHFLKWDPVKQTEEEDVVSASDQDALLSMVSWFTKEL